MDRCLEKQSLSDFKYYCPVTWRNEKLLVKCHENVEDVVLYNNQFYYFKSTKEREMFLSNPTRFLMTPNFP
jgi:YHS domain-containing protein